MYFIAAGEVQVILRGGPVTLKDGDFFGEGGLLERRPRNADVISAGYSHLLVLYRKDFNRTPRPAAGGAHRDRGGGGAARRRPAGRGRPVGCSSGQTGYQPREFCRFRSVLMSLDKDTVARIARLARLKVPEEELAPLAGELSGIFAWIEQLNEVDTRNVEPLSSVSDVTLPMREDKVTDGGIAEKILANAPGGAVYIEPTDKNAGGFFTVPKVVE